MSCKDVNTPTFEHSQNRFGRLSKMHADVLGRPATGDGLRGRWFRRLTSRYRRRPQDRRSIDALFAARRAARRYRTARSLAAEHQALIDTFIALRRLQLTMYALEQWHEPTFRDIWAAALTKDLRRLDTFARA